MSKKSSAKQSAKASPPPKRTANPLGIRRRCQACSGKFYDLNHDPIICPLCGAVFDPEVLLKSRRTKPLPKQKTAAQASDVADDAADIIDLNKDNGDSDDVSSTDDSDIKDVALDVDIDSNRDDES